MSTRGKTLQTIRLYRRLLETTNHFDKNPFLKSLLVKPKRESGDHPFFRQFFGDSVFYLPFQSTQNPLTFSHRDVSLTQLAKEHYRKNEVTEHSQEKYWEVMRQLLHVITYAENNPATGLLDDEKYYKYSCNLIRSYLDRARSRKESSTPLVKLAESLKAGVCLVAHPILPNQYWRNAVIQILEHTEEHSQGVILNFLRNADEENPHIGLEGGPYGRKQCILMYKTPDNGSKVQTIKPPSEIVSKPVAKEDESSLKSDVADTESETDDSDTSTEGFSSDDDTSEFPVHLDSNGVTFTTDTLSAEDMVRLNPRTIYGRTIWSPKQLDKEVSQGCWIPVEVEAPLLLEDFQTPTESFLTNDSHKLRRLYWEEVLRSLGGDYVPISKLSSTYRRYF